jgi:hypothetical protein
MESMFEDGLRSTADDYLGKPFDLTEVEPGCGPWCGVRRERTCVS